MHIIQRPLYIKYGNVVSEYQKIQSTGTFDGDLGYLKRFCQLTEGTQRQILSFGLSTSACHRGGTDVKVVGQPVRMGIFKGLFDQPLKFFFPVYSVHQKKMDLIVCGRIDVSLWGAVLAAKLFRIPIILSCHHSLPFEYNLFHKLRNLIHRAMIKQCDHVICPGLFLKDHLRAIGVKKDKIKTFLPSVTALMEKNCKNFSTALPNDYIFFFGRIEENKGVFILLSAYKRLTVENSQLPSLVFAGDGTAAPILKKEIEVSGLTADVHLIGKIPYQDIGLLIRKSRFVVIPSRSDMNEGICKAAIEAIVCGKPVIAPNYGVFPYLVSNGQNGLLYRTDDFLDLSAQMKKLIFTQDLLRRLTLGAQQKRISFLNSRKTFSDVLTASLRNLSLEFPV